MKLQCSESTTFHTPDSRDLQLIASLPKDTDKWIKLPKFQHGKRGQCQPGSSDR